MGAESVTAQTSRRRGTGALVALHVAGLVASSHLLERAVRHLPGFETSGLAGRLARAGAATAGTGPAGSVAEGASALLREAVLPATVEELLFRGVFYALLHRFAGPRAAILGSAVLFGLAHGDPHHAIAAALLGVPLGCLRAQHGLAAAWLAHAVHDALACSGAPGLVLAAFGSTLCLAAAGVLAGSSNAVLLQALRSSERCGAAHGSAASGDAGV